MRRDTGTWRTSPLDVSSHESDTQAFASQMKDTQPQQHKERYGLNLSEFPEEKDLLIYERFAHLGENRHQVEKNKTASLSGILPLEAVSCFPDDSVFEVSAPVVDTDSRDVFERHVLTGQGQLRALCREDMLTYREYVKNRYM